MRPFRSGAAFWTTFLPTVLNLSAFMSVPSPSALARAAVRTFVPFGGPTLVTHVRNHRALNAAPPPMPDLTERDRVLVIAPHPDDEILCCGGILARASARGIAARVAFVTNGDGSRTGQIFKTLRQPLARDNDLFSIAQHRQIEALDALQKVGIGEADADFLGFPDGGLTAITRMQGDEIYWAPTTRRNHVAYPRAYAPGARYLRGVLLDLMTKIIGDFAPTLILTGHHLDTHPDHAATYPLAVAASERAGLKAAPRIGQYLVHYGIWPVPNGLHADQPIAPPAALLKRDWQSLALSPDEIAAKLAALECYDSQLVSLPRYLRAFVRRNEIFEMS